MGVGWRSLEMPKKLDCDESTYTPTYGKFYAEPFERGYASTIGNSLRRILISSLEGGFKSKRMAVSLFLFRTN